MSGKMKTGGFESENRELRLGREGVGQENRGFSSTALQPLHDVTNLSASSLCYCSILGTAYTEAMERSAGVGLGLNV